MAYVIARTAAGGRSEGLASCLGTGLGGMVHVVAAVLGVSLVIRSPPSPSASSSTLEPVTSSMWGFACSRARTTPSW